MNNIEELKAAATVMRLSSTMRITDEIITFRRLFTPDCALALIAQLEAAQKERDDLLNQEFQQRLANAEHQLYMKDLAIHNIKASRKAQFRKRLAAEAALSAANEKLSKPVILSTSTVMSRACAVRAIKAAGFTVEGE